jgi:hypothetical protein
VDVVVLWLLLKLCSLLEIHAKLAHTEHQLPPVTEFADADLLQIFVCKTLQNRTVHLRLTKQLSHIRWQRG